MCVLLERSLRITEELLAQGSCQISRPFGAPEKLRHYLETNQTARLRRRLESNAKSLYAMYEYGRLHGAPRLTWGFLDEMFPVPWVHREEPTLYNLKRRAYETGALLELVVGRAPGWVDPWARSDLYSVLREGYSFVAVDAHGYAVDERDVQRARLVATQ